jgi:hypothetical protein
VSNANPNRPQSAPSASRPATDVPGRTALVSMFPLHMEPPSAPARPEHRGPQRPESMNGGK